MAPESWDIFQRLYGPLVGGSFDDEEEGRDRGGGGGDDDDTPGAAKRHTKAESIKTELTDVELCIVLPFRVHLRTDLTCLALCSLLASSVFGGVRRLGVEGTFGLDCLA